MGPLELARSSTGLIGTESFYRLVSFVVIGPEPGSCNVGVEFPPDKRGSEHSDDTCREIESLPRSEVGVVCVSTVMSIGIV